MSPDFKPLSLGAELAPENRKDRRRELHQKRIRDRARKRKQREQAARKRAA